MRSLVLGFLLFAVSLAGAVSVFPSSVSIDACICDVAVQPLAIENAGSDGAYVSFGVSGSEDWAFVTPTHSLLSAGQSTTVYSYFTPSCFAKPGVYNFEVKVNSTDGMVVVPVELNVQPCLSIEPVNFQEKAGRVEDTVCLNEAKDYYFILKNKSRTASKNYSVQVSGNGEGAVIFNEIPRVASSRIEQVFVKAEGQTASGISFDASKFDKPGIYNFSLRFVSLYEATGAPTFDEARLNFDINVTDCHGARFSVKPAEICTDLDNVIPIVLENTGKTDSFAVSVEGIPSASLSKKTVSIPAGESAQLDVNVPLGLRKGVYSIKLTASSANSIAVKTIDLSAAECFDVRITGRDDEVCQCESKGFVFGVTNTGTRNDGFKVIMEEGESWLRFEERHMDLKAGAKNSVAASVATCNVTPGDYYFVLTALADSKNSSDSLCFNVTVNPREACYQGSFGGETEVLVPVSQIHSISIPFYNSGLSENAYEIKVTGPSWVELQSQDLFLGKNKNAVIELSTNPPEDALYGEFDVVVEAVSKGVVSAKILKLKVIEPATVEQQTIPAEVTLDGNTLVVSSLPDCVVSLTTPSGEKQEFPVANGTLEMGLGEEGVYSVIVGREGLQPKAFSVDTRSQTVSEPGTDAGKFNGLLIVLALVVVIALFYIAFQFLGGRKLLRK
ncbi:MAG: hypothetical protein V1834_03550 [Candidatus Micrarchaeota archaeon]